MSISINRNEIIHMDDYFRDRKREGFKPLIQSLAHDLMDNGFTDVGPNITKISISDDALTNFIDEFICFYYDSAVGSAGSGAGGIELYGAADGSGTNVNTDQGGHSSTIFFLDGENGSRVKQIDDIYDDADWHDNLAMHFPKLGHPALFQKTHNPDNQQQNADSVWSGFTDADGNSYGGNAAETLKFITTETTYKQVDTRKNGIGQTLGPNSELFAYINPHPNRRGSTQAIRDFISPGFASSPSNGDTHKLGGETYTYSTSISLWVAADGSTHTGTSSLAADDLLGGQVRGIPFGSGWKDIADLVEAHTSGFVWPVQSGAKTIRGTARESRPLDLKDGEFYKKIPKNPPMISTTKNFDSNGTQNGGKELTITSEFFQTGYFGLPEIAKAVYLNEYDKVKRLVTHQARDVVMRPELSSGVNTAAKIRNYKEEIASTGPNMHNFWISNYQDENFFPAGTVEPKKFKGELMIGFDPTYGGNTFQTGDVYTFTFNHTAFGAGAQSFVLQVPVIDSSVAGFTRDVYQKMLSNQICDPKSGPYDVIDGGDLNPKRNGVLLIESKQIGSNLTSTITRTERPTVGYVNAIQSFTITDSNFKFESTINNALGSDEKLGELTYTEGYVHEIQLRGFDGANNDDEFEFTLTGLLEEQSNGGLADANAPTTRNETVYFKTPVALNSGQLTYAIAEKIRTNAYVNKYMEVISNSNAITIRYNRLSSGYMRKSENGKTHGLLAATSLTLGAAGDVVPGTTIGQSTSHEFRGNGFAVADLPAKAKFNVIGNSVDASNDEANVVAMRIADDAVSASTDLVYSGAVLLAETSFAPVKTSGQIGFDGDPFNYGGDSGNVEVVQAGLGTTIKKVRLEFPLSRDLGTFGNPVQGQYKAFLACDKYNATSYSVSYDQMVISKDTGRPEGPQVSFDPAVSKQHPNASHGGIQNGAVVYSEFPRYSHEIEIDSFEYVTDYSMGPIVLETDRKHKLSGYPTGVEGDTEGDQPWRIRLNVTRGNEVQEASPYIADAVLQVNPFQDSTNTFEYLQVHIATEFQLKGNGEIARPEGKDGMKAASLREPGHLGGIRPQYRGYLETAVHKVNPFVQRARLDGSIRSGFNFYAGVVGLEHFNDNLEQKDGYSAPFIRGLSDGATTPKIIDYFSVAGLGNGQIPLKTTGSREKVDFDSGILKDAEYRFEEKFLMGTSTELTTDTPYNNGKLRLQKGFFKRSGKSDSNIAPAYPMSYHLTIADQGIAFYLRDQASTTQSDDNAFFVVQRHVHSSAEVGTGTISDPQYPAGFVDIGIDGSDHQPIHCVYQSSEPTVLFSDFEPLFTEKSLERRSSIANMGLYNESGDQTFDFFVTQIDDGELATIDLETQSRFRRFVVREKDVLKPWDRHVFAGLSERDSTSIINPLEQLSLNDRGKLVIQFPNRLGSQRFMYTGREIDMIGFCGAGAVGQDTLISSDRMSTGTEGGTGTSGDNRRLYRGMMSTGKYGSGMRILLLVAENNAGDSVMATTADIRLLDN